MSIEKIPDNKILIGKRLKEARQAKNLTLIQLCEVVEIKSNGYLSNVENGKQSLSQEILFFLSKRFGLNVNWLLTGEGPMFGVGEPGQSTGPPKKGLQACQECGQALNVGALLESQERVIEEKERLILRLEKSLTQADGIIASQQAEIERQKNAVGIMGIAQDARKKA